MCADPLVFRPMAGATSSSQESSLASTECSRSSTRATKAYNTDRNNWAPSVGFAWTLPPSSGILGSLMGREDGDSVIRAGYTLAYERPGMAEFATAIDDNPGISQTANRNHSLGNLGTPGSVLLRNQAQLGPPAFPTTRIYPMTDVVTGDIMTFDPNLQMPYAQTWTAGWQRKLTSDMAVEARYVGSRSLQSWVKPTTTTRPTSSRTTSSTSSVLAQQNLQAHVAAGCSGTGSNACSFAYRGAGTGTSPLPTFLAYFNGRNDVSNTAAYSGTNWTSSTFTAFLAARNPNPYGMVTNTTNTTGTGLMNDETSPPECAASRAAGELLRRQPGSTLAAPKSSATAATRSTTPCSSNCASGCRTGSRSRATTSSARRTSRSVTRCAHRARRSSSQAARAA